MVRTKGAGAHRKQAHKKVLEQAKGYRGRASKSYRIAKQAVVRAGQYSYIHRKKRGNEFRKLWIMRINARLRSVGMKYSVFMGKFNGMIAKGAIEAVSRKMLSESAIRAPHVFEAILNKVVEHKD